MQVQNPDKDNFQPGKILGIGELKLKYLREVKMLAKLDKTIDEGNEFIVMLDKTAQKIETDLLRCQQNHARLSGRMLSILGRLETLRALGQPRGEREIRFLRVLVRMCYSIPSKSAKDLVMSSPIGAINILSNECLCVINAAPWFCIMTTGCIAKLPVKPIQSRLVEGAAVASCPSSDRITRSLHLLADCYQE